METKLKDSGIPWIGFIPEHWNNLNMKRNISFHKGSTPKQWSDTPSEIPYLSMDYLRGREDVQTLFPIYDSSLLIANENDLLVLWDGANAGEFIKSKYGYVGSTMAKLSFEPTKLNRDYLFYFLKSVEIVSKDFANGTTIPHFTPTFLAGNYPIPPLKEQERIAAWLDMKCGEIDELIEVEKQMIVDLEAYRQAVITEAVTHGLNPDTTSRDSGYDWIGNIPSDWNIKRLRFLGTTQNGISKDGSYFGEGYPFVSYGDVYNNYFLPENPVSLCKSDSIDQQTYSIKYGDVLFTRTSETIEEIGFSAACRCTIPQAVFSGFLIRFRPTTNEIIPEYAGYYFRSNIHRTFFVKEMNIVTRASLGQNLLRNLPVLLPNISEQREIALYLDSKCAEVDELIKLKQKKIEILKQYRQSLIFEAVTGKTTVD